MLLELASYISNNKNNGYKENRKGNLYSRREMKYFSVDGRLKRNSMPKLTNMPVTELLLRNVSKEKPDLYFIRLSEVWSLDNPKTDDIIVEKSNRKSDQQFKIELVDSNDIDSIRIIKLGNNGGQKCFTANLSKIYLEECHPDSDVKYGQIWFWLPKKMIDKVIISQLERELQDGKVQTN